MVGPEPQRISLAPSDCRKPALLLASQPSHNERGKAGWRGRSAPLPRDVSRVAEHGG